MPNNTTTSDRAARLAETQRAVAAAAKEFDDGWGRIEKAREKIDKTKADAAARAAKVKADGDQRIAQVEAEAEQTRQEVITGLKPAVEKLAALGMDNKGIAALVGVEPADIVAIRKQPHKQPQPQAPTVIAAAPFAPSGIPAPVRAETERPV